jgi:hypothetical protein
MSQHNDLPTESLVQLSIREMQEVLGGASVDRLLKLPGVEVESTRYVGTANGGVWKTTNF